MFARQGFQERYAGRPVEFRKPRDVLREKVVVHDASVFLLVLRYDVVVTIQYPLVEMYGLSVSHIPGAFLLDNLRWHEQPNPSVGAASFVGVFYVGLLVDDFVSKEARGLARRVSNQGFVFGECEL